MNPQILMRILQMLMGNPMSGGGGAGEFPPGGMRGAAGPLFPPGPNPSQNLMVDGFRTGGGDPGPSGWNLQGPPSPSSQEVIQENARRKAQEMAQWQQFQPKQQEMTPGMLYRIVRGQSPYNDQAILGVDNPGPNMRGQQNMENPAQQKMLKILQNLMALNQGQGQTQDQVNPYQVRQAPGSYTPRSSFAPQYTPRQDLNLRSVPAGKPPGYIGHLI